jgi:transcriptional regulator
MRANNFPILITGTGGVLHASHLPVTVFEKDNQIFIDMHMAKNNPQWREFFDDEVLVVFHGPHGYVSPRWYADKTRVPTWNYAAVHAYGAAKIIEDKKAKEKNQRHLVEVMDPEWLKQHDRLPREYVEQMLDGIVNFTVAVTRIDTRWKLSQNRGRREMELIAGALEKTGREGDRALAALTRKHLVEG